MINSMGGEGKVVREWLTKQDGGEAEAEIHRKFMGSKWSKEYTHMGQYGLKVIRG